MPLPISWKSLFHRTHRTAPSSKARTEREIELRTQEVWLQKVVENLAEGLIIVDPRGLALHWNQKALAMHGFDGQQSEIGFLYQAREIYDLATLDGQPIEFEQWPVPRLLRGEVLRDYEVVIRQKRCDWERIFSYGGVMLRDERGNPTIALLTIRDITDRKRDELELARSQALLAEAERLSHAGAWEWDLKTGRWSFSDEWMAIHGCTGRALGPDALLAIAHPLDRDAIREAFDNVRSGIAPYDMLHKIIRADNGEERIVRARGQFVRDASGNVVRIYGFAQDVTEPMRAREELERAHQKLQNMIDSITDGLMVLGRDWRISYVSQTGARMLGIPREDLLAQNIWEMFPRAIGTKFYDEYVRSMETGRPVSFEEYYPEPLNMWLELHCYPSADGLSIYFRDITDRKRTENRLRRFYDSGMVGVIYWTVDGRITNANDKFLAMVGYTRDDLDAGLLDWAQMTPPEQRELDAYAIRELMATGIDTPYEKDYIRKDGSRIPVVVGAAMLDEARHEGVAFVLDNTERNRISQALSVANERLQEADRRKDEFLAVLAHELRNPLAPIRYSAQMLKIDTITREQISRQRDIIDRQVTHMGRLLDDLLEISRITRGKIQLKRELLDLRAVAAHAVDSLRALIEGRGQRLAYQRPDVPLTVYGDPTRLEQIIRNLLHNANKYTEEGGRIVVSLSADSGRAVIRVSDTGLGIPPDMLPHIFDPFVQVEQTLARTQGGLGIGLSMVKSMVALHGGSVEVESEIGKGSVFTVLLPIVDAIPAAVRPPEQQPAQFRPSRVLVVEDNEDAAATLSELLRLWGHEVETAGDGHHALATAAAWQPEIVLLDIGLPGMDGYEVARRLRNEPATAGALLVALTGYGQDDDRRRSREAGIDQHLTKPVDIARLQSLFQKTA